MLSTLFYFFLALFLLVVFHEYGHFQVARWCGVKVLRFSFGFGRIFLRFFDKKGTEYVISWLPFGGYVKMLDESEEEVAPEERHLAFNNQSLWKRVLIVLAGPVFNFLFAFVALWLVAVIGLQSLAPMVASVKPGSIAASAGITSQEEIVAIEDKPINSWRDFQFALMPYIGSEQQVSVTVKEIGNGKLRHLLLPLANWHIDSKNPDILDSFGIEPFVPAIPPIIAEIMPDSPATHSGIAPGDRIIQLNGKKIDDWFDLVSFVKKNPDKEILITVLRDGKPIQIKLRIGEKTDAGKQQGYLGLQVQETTWPKNWLRTERYGLIEAIPLAANQTADLAKATLTLIGRLFTGELGLQNLSGPVGIAQGAGDSARSGLVYYLSFLALVSISLGVLNLLPIPMLDGGHLLYYLIEALSGKPVKESTKSLGVYMGLFFLVMIMAISLYNDLSRLLS